MIVTLDNAREEESAKHASAGSLIFKAVRGAGVNVVAQLIGLFCQITGVVVLGRLLTPTDFGLVTMVTAFSGWFMNFGENGFAEYIIQKEHIDQTEVNSIFWLHVFVASGLAILFTIFGACLVVFYSEPKLWRIAAVLSLSFVLTAFSTSQLALLKREMAFSSIALLGLIAVGLSVVLSVAAAGAGMSYWAVVIRQMTIPFVTMIGAWMLCPWRPNYPRFISKSLSGLRYAMQVYGNFSITYVVRNIDKVLLGRFHGIEVLGNYDRAYYLSTMPVAQLLAPLDNVVLATLSRLTNDRARFVAYYTKAVTMVSFLGTAMALILTVSSNDIILLLLGRRWASAGPIVRAFGPGIAGMLIYGTHSWLHLSLGTPNRWLRWNIFSSVLTVAALAVAAPAGSVAMALTYSVTAYVLVVPALWYGGQPIGFKVMKVIRALWPYLVSAATVFVSWLLLSAYCIPTKIALGTVELLLRVLLVSAAVLVAYVTLVVLLQRSLGSVRDCARFVRIFLAR